MATRGLNKPPAVASLSDFVGAALWSALGQAATSQSDPDLEVGSIAATLPQPNA